MVCLASQGFGVQGVWSCDLCFVVVGIGGLFWFGCVVLRNWFAFWVGWWLVVYVFVVVRFLGVWLLAISRGLLICVSCLGICVV